MLFASKREIRIMSYDVMVKYGVIVSYDVIQRAMTSHVRVRVISNLSNDD